MASATPTITQSGKNPPSTQSSEAAKRAEKENLNMLKDLASQPMEQQVCRKPALTRWSSDPAIQKTKTTTRKYHNNNDRARLDTTNNKRELKNELKNDILAPVTGSNVGWVDWGASPGEVWAKERVKGAMAESADVVRRKQGTPERQKIVWNPKDEALFSVSCALYI